MTSRPRIAQTRPAKRIGDVCVVATITGPPYRARGGRWQLARITATDKRAGELIVLRTTDPRRITAAGMSSYELERLTGQRTHAITIPPRHDGEVLAARRMWADYTAAGCPTFRSRAETSAYVIRYMEAKP